MRGRFGSGYTTAQQSDAAGRPPGRRRPIALAAAVAMAAIGGTVFAPVASAAALPAGCTASGVRVTCTYGYTGAEQTFAVPAGVTSVTVTAIGAAGGREVPTTEGSGAAVAGTVPVVPGQTLYVEVGQAGSFRAEGATFNGGGAARFAGQGGGASDVRTASGGSDPSATALGARVIVAGGGGGQAERSDASARGQGGSAGADGTPASVDGPNAQGGRAGTDRTGGAGGNSGVSPNGTVRGFSLAGGPGRGGAGALGNASGGGGGAGLNGGGGGGSGFAGARYGVGGGGGGGSSLVPPGGSQPVITQAAASVTISYDLATTTTLSASPNPSTTGQQVTLTADVAGLGSSAPTGTVTFRDGSTALGTVALSNGRATLATSQLATGPHTLTAVYSGDATNAGSTSAPVTQTVNAPAPASISATSGGGQSAQPGAAFAQPLVATVTDGAGAPSVNQPVTFTVTSGSASFPGGATSQVTTGSDGRATSATLTAGSAPGPVTVTATTGALSTSYTLSVQAPPAAITVRGAGTLSAGGKNYSISVDAQATAAGQASGRFVLSGGGADTTVGSRTITGVTRTGTGSTVSGTAVTSSGMTVSFTLTVVDRSGGQDQVTVALGSTTLSGMLVSGDITTS